MDHLLVSQDLCADSTPSRQGTPLQYVLKRTETGASSLTVIDGTPLGNFHHHNPCPAVDHWTSSGPSSPTPMMSCQIPWVVGSQAFLASSHSPTQSIPDGLPRFFFPYDNGWPSSSMTSGATSGQLKPGLPRPDNGRTSSEWMRGSDKSASYTLKPDCSHTASSEAFGYLQQSSRNLTRAYPTAALTPQSPATSASSGQLRSPAITSAIDHANTRTSPDDTEDDANADPPYSSLIYKALSQADDMQLPLQGIYSWFEKNTAKGRDPNSKGWQNSIRHNLSMNAVCLFFIRCQFASSLFPLG
jgi:hypothetical protein